MNFVEMSEGSLWSLGIIDPQGQLTIKLLIVNCEKHMQKLKCFRKPCPLLLVYYSEVLLGTTEPSIHWEYNF